MIRTIAFCLPILALASLQPRAYEAQAGAWRLYDKFRPALDLAYHLGEGDNLVIGLSCYEGRSNIVVSFYPPFDSDARPNDHGIELREGASAVTIAPKPEDGTDGYAGRLFVSSTTMTSDLSALLSDRFRIYVDNEELFRVETTPDTKALVKTFTQACREPAN